MRTQGSHTERATRSESPRRALAVCILSAWVCNAAAQDEPIAGLPCERCDGVFIGMPEAFGSQASMATPDESGERMSIDGTVRDDDDNERPVFQAGAGFVDVMRDAPGGLWRALQAEP